MQCPTCSRRLRKVHSRGHVVDTCPACGGVWLEASELPRHVTEVSQGRALDPEPTTLFKPRSGTNLYDLDEARRMCPRCGVGMHKLNYAVDSNVILDRCPQCRGTWLDCGELARLAAHLRTAPRVRALGISLIKQQKEAQAWKDLADACHLISRTAWVYGPRIVLPLSDDLRRERFPVVTVSIIALCVAIFLLAPDVGFYDTFGAVPADLWRVGTITSMFLHANIVHLVGNMFFLWLFGDNVEDRLGRIGFLIFYVSSGIVAVLLHTVFNRGSEVPCIGASGAVSGVMGAYCVLFPSARITTFFVYRVIYIPAVLYLGLWFVLQLHWALLSTTGVGSNIAFFAHVGGFAFGAGLAQAMKKRSCARKPANA